MLYFTEFKKIEEDESVYETTLHLREGLSPIFKIRAVRASNDLYGVIIRDNKTGYLLQSNFINERHKTHNDALYAGIRLAKLLMKEMLND